MIVRLVLLSEQTESTKNKALLLQNLFEPKLD